MNKQLIDNDNGDLSYIKSNIDNDKTKGCGKGCGKHSPAWHAERAKRTEEVADMLVEIFNAPSSRNFFLKCAWHLSEYQITQAINRSRLPNIKMPVKYFVRTCNNEMLKKYN